VGHLLYDLSGLPFLVKEGIGWAGVNAGQAGLADLFVSGELAGKGLLEGDSLRGADLGAPTAMHAPVEVDDGLSFQPQAAVFRQLSVFYLDAGLRADINTQAAVHASIVYSRGL
jgi:hypothetical protein